MGKKRIPPSIWALGFVSMFTDISSELVNSVLPLFMTSVFGASMILVGSMEGVKEAIPFIVKLFSGILSDVLHERKILTLIGYTLSAISKIFFPVATHIPVIFMAQLVDRMGKGVRDTPRDALIADIAPPGMISRCFGLRQTLDTLGAFLGPLLSIILLIIFSGNIRNILWFAIVPASMSVIILLCCVKEPKKMRPPSPAKTLLSFSGSSTYWKVCIVTAILMLSRFGQGFLVLKAKEVGISITFAPIVIIFMNIMFALSAYPAGVLGDKFERKILALLGMIFLIAASITLGLAHNISWTILGVILWGLHLGFNEGIFAALITDFSRPEERGTAFGIYYFINGIALFLANIIGGILWESFSSSYAFFYTAVLSSLSFVGFFWCCRRW